MTDKAEKQQVQLNSIEEAVKAIREGKVIIVVDDENRENEGDFVCAAELTTPEIVNFMATHGRGLICTPIPAPRAEQLNLHMMAPQNTSHHETAFTVSVDYIGKGCTTGISAYDRATCIRALADPEALSTDFARPGHIFPLKAKPGGVLQRIGHTEASVDLAVMAGLHPAGVLVEILNEDGTMARLPQLLEIAKKHHLIIISIKDLVDYRMRNERLVRKVNKYPLELDAGHYELLIFEQADKSRQHVALKYGDWTINDEVPVRVESIKPNEVLLKFLAGQMDNRIRQTLDIFGEKGRGLLVFVYRTDDHLSQDEIVYNMSSPQDQSDYSPSEVQKDIGIGAQVIHSCQVRKMQLVTNHPNRKVAVEGYGLEVVDYLDMNKG